MKAKISRGKGFRGTLNYALDEGKKRTGDKNPIIVAGNMSGKNAKALSREFSFSRSLRPNTKNPVWHCSLALPKGETIDSGKWDRLINRFLKEMGIDTGKHQFIAVKHHDTDNEHVHIIMSRIGMDSKLWHGRNDVMTAIEATQKLEKEFGLTLTAGYLELDANGNKVKRKARKKSPKSKEIQMAARTGEAPKRLMLQQIIDEATKDQIDVFSFIERLECAGVVVRPNVAKTGRLNGFSFELDGIPFKGSDLGDDYKWGKTSNLKNKISYDQDRDGEQLRRTAERIKQGASERSGSSPEANGGGQPADRSGSNPNSQQLAGSGNSQSAGSQASPDPIQQSSEQHKNGERQGSNPDQNRHGKSERFGEIHQVSNSQVKQSTARTGAGRGDTTAAQARQRLKGRVDSVQRRSAAWGAANSTVDALAAPFNSHTGATQQSPDAIKKIEAWRKQHKALGAPAYRITVKPRKGGSPWNIGNSKDGDEVYFTADEVEAKIPLLRQKNAKGNDIYITPIDDDNYYMVVDDVTFAKHMEMNKKGFKPTLVQESSKDNRQLIFKVPKTKDELDRPAANAVVASVNKKYGDPQFTGAVHAFRMAGFSNKKAGRNNAFTRLISSATESCQLMVGIFGNAITELKKRVDNKATQERLKEIREYPQFSNDVESTFQRLWSKYEGLARHNNWKIDYSRIDLAAATELVELGAPDESIETAIVNCSPSITEVRPDKTAKWNPQVYAEKTVKAAHEKAKPPQQVVEKTPEQSKKRRARKDARGNVIGWIEE